jgi:hypothetical protein
VEDLLLTLNSPDGSKKAFARLTADVDALDIAATKLGLVSTLSLARSGESKKVRHIEGTWVAFRSASDTWAWALDWQWKELTYLRAV